MNQSVYIHYGKKKFDPLAFNPIENIAWRNKPKGGLWASPVGAKFGWKDWCEREEFADCKEENSFKFRLSDNANVYHLYCKKDIEAIPMQEGENLCYFTLPDFEKLLEDGYDAIEYHLSDEIPTEDCHDSIYFVLRGWDCDSILILNPAVVIPISDNEILAENLNENLI